jgi:hypothetical protein
MATQSSKTDRWLFKSETYDKLQLRCELWLPIQLT